MAVVPEVSAESTDLFVGPEDALKQVVRVHLPPGSAAAAVRIDGDGLTCDDVLAQPGTEIVEVAVTVTDPMPGRSREARVVVGDASAPFTFVDAEPGWTMYMISHFHYDPVWWNTQAAYTSSWTEDPPGRCRQTNGFDLVAAHLDMARREPEYKFVLAEVDYLKPYWDARPEDRAELRRMIADGRVEVMGGTYNEPNTNLTSPETAIRNFVHGIGFQRDVMGANPATAWQLDVFGHDPQFPGMAADAGLTSSSWARGPHHQWGPMAGDGDPERMQFASEFEWLAPSGRGLLTHYMPAHYAAGWWMDSSPTLAEAEVATYALFAGLKKVALTRNVLLPVGTDYTPPNKWVTEIHRDWNARYTWPRFVCALPSEFFTAVRTELDERGAAPAPQTRDMNPIYTGKDVSYVDTKQANRAAEHAVLQAERFAVFAGLIAGAAYPHSALAKAWVQLAYGAHHDAITGSESDQVYLDLLTSWRDAWDLGRTVRDSAFDVLTGAVEGDVVVWNPLAHSRTDVVTVHLDQPITGTMVDTNGAELPTLIEHGGHTVSWLAHDVPSMGWRAHRTSKVAPSAWETLPSNEIQNAHHRIRVDAARGGGVTSWTAAGRQLIAEGRVGNELAVYDEYPAHPEAGEGPWHLLPKGPLRTSSDDTADVRAERCALGERLTIDGRIEGVLRYTQTITLWREVDRVDCRTVIDEFTGQDALLRLRWPCPVPGAMPVSEVGDAVIGRGFGLMHEPGDHAHAVDSARHPHTLDNPAYGWFGLSSALRIRVRGAGPGGDEADGVRAISVAEIVTAVGAEASPAVRDLSVALVRAGVTTTCSHADKPRYGDLTVDSNLPDARIALGGPDVNAFTAALLAAADPAYAAELRRQLDDSGVARVWVPASRALAERWVPGADLRDVRALPVLVLAAEGGIESIVAAVVDDLADAEITVSQQTPHGIGEFDARTVAVMNRGVPSFAVDSDGTLHTSLMRSCTGWPSGTWIDPPRRTVPDGSNFQLQHWTHDFDYALVASVGDWRDAGLPARSAEYSQPLLGVVSRHRDGAGRLPAWGSMLEIEPAGQVALAACKVAGNAIAHGNSRHVEPEDGITLRLVETHGRSTEVSLRSGLRSVSAAQRVDLLESPLTDADGAALHGYEIATIHAELNLPRLDGAGPVGLVTEAEAAQPLYARYWLHNRGPAPMGGLPAVAHLDPQRVTAAPGSTVALRLTAASDCTDATLHGHVRLVCPAGVSAIPDELPFLLPPGEYLQTAVSIDIPSNIAPGRYPVRAELAVTGHSDIPPSWRQLVEDVCWITVGDGTDDVLRHDVLRLVGGPEPIDVPAGGSATLSVTVGTDAKADLSIEAHLISPWGTWEWVGPSAVGADLPAGGTAQLNFDVSPPAWVRPGQWWALVRVACAGHLLYTPAVAVTVR